MEKKYVYNHKKWNSHKNDQGRVYQRFDEPVCLTIGFLKIWLDRQSTKIHNIQSFKADLKCHSKITSFVKKVDTVKWEATESVDY